MSLEVKLASTENQGLGVEEVVREAEERYRRRKFLIVSGIPEHGTGKVEERKQLDSQTVIDLANHLGIRDFEPKDVARIGSIDSSKPRLLRFKCIRLETKYAFLKEARSLKSSDSFKNVYINPDQTFHQREKSRKMRVELKMRREAGENVRIQRGRIVRQTDKQDFL